MLQNRWHPSALACLKLKGSRESSVERPEKKLPQYRDKTGGQTEFVYALIFVQKLNFDCTNLPP